LAKVNKFKLYFRKSSFKKNSIIICDDYNMLNYRIKKAVNEIKNNYYFEDLGRFALIRT